MIKTFMACYHFREVSFIMGGGGSLFVGGRPKFFGVQKGGAKFFLGVQEGEPEFFFAPSVRFPILSLSKNFLRLRRNFSYTYTIIISQYIFDHTPGLKGHGCIAREVGCLELQQGGPEFFQGQGRARFLTHRALVVL